jgi:hypothetical protein
MAETTSTDSTAYRVLYTTRDLEGAFNTQFRLAGNTPKSERFVTAIESIRALANGKPIRL